MQKKTATPRHGARSKSKAPAKIKRAGPGKSAAPKAVLSRRIGKDAGFMGGPKPANARSGISYSVLTNALQTKSLFDIAIGCNDREGEGWVKLLDTERKQLKCIADLWGIVKAQPKYADLDKKDWKATDRPLTVIAWLMRKLGVLANGNKWCVDLQQGRYVFVVYKNFHSQKVRNDIEWVSLDFLPMLAVKDKGLHDLIIDLVALVHVRNAIPLWDDDYYTGQALKYLLRQDAVDSGVRDGYKALYTTGHAGQYLRLIRERAKVVSVQSVKKCMASYRVENTRDGRELSQRKRLCLWWITEGVVLAEWGRKIKEFSFTPSWMGKHVAAEHLYKWMWDTGQSDPVKMRHQTLFDNDEGEQGLALPVTFTVCHPGEVLQQLIVDRPPKKLSHNYGYYSQPAFAEALCDFLKDGLVHFTCAAYESYYYNNRKPANQPLTTSGVPLLDIIERNELINEMRNS